MNSITLRRHGARILISSAYFVCMFQWLWLAMIGMPPLIESGVFDLLVSPAQQAEVEQPSAANLELSSPAMIVVGIVTLVMIVVTIVILIKLPKAVVDTGQTITQATTKAVVPAVLHHKKVSAKKQRIISRRVMLAVQIGLSILPAIVVVLIPVPKELPADGLRLVTLILLTVSLLGFLAGWLIEPPASTKKRKTT